MKLLKGILILPLLLGVLYACNDDTEVDKDELVTGNNNNVNETTDNTTNENGTTGTNDNGAENQQTGNQVSVNYPFTYFELDVEYANDVSYDVEYANDGTNISAELEDDFNRVQSEGDPAFNSISPYLEKLTFDENSSDEEVRDEVLKTFELENNYTSFDLEVKFESGKVKKYHFK